MIEYAKIRKRQLRNKLILSLVMVILIYATAVSCQVSLANLISGIPAGFNFLKLMFPPDVDALSAMLKPTLDTVLFAFLATIFGSIISLVLAFGGAANLAPAWLRNTCRLIMTVERALPEVIIILLLVAALGLGPFPGVIALSLGCIGMLGKLFADAIEEVSPKVIESVASVGASKWQVILYAVMPLVLPSLIANTIFRFEVNIRLSVLLGAVGAGGIGYELFRAFSLLQYEQATTAILLTLGLVFLSERLSDFLRKKIVPNSKLT